MANYSFSHPCDDYKKKTRQINKIVVRNAPTLGPPMMMITSRRVQLIKRLVDLTNQSLMKRPSTHARQQQQQQQWVSPKSPANNNKNKK